MASKYSLSHNNHDGYALTSTTSPKALYEHRTRRARKQQYEGRVIDALVQVWELFDYPCAQRLKPILDTELERLISLDKGNHFNSENLTGH